ncbi:MAG: 23S rRNA (adenine(2503)-C(2))-methyltransferase RlmN [Candidatus Omnitrophica bacterium]|nr:23S rRNA (adenine(2503)-C(2))-methyltransferase RlmN [Candidatus Omnitrophota bacterium]
MKEPGRVESSRNILEDAPKGLAARFAGLGFPAYRARQVLRWVYERGVYDFDKMTDLPLEMRRKLKTLFSVSLPVVAGSQRSREDKSVKALLKLQDGEFVETVYIPVKGRETVCVSSQAGCKFHCAFCASGQGGFFRNLTAGEIVSQVLAARDFSPQKKVSHVVFMGIGEPFDNYNEVLKAVRLLNSPETLGIGARKITVSTCGIVPKIKAFAGEGLQVELSVSLHGATDAVRGAVMPVDRAYPVGVLIKACREYARKTNRAVTFEYILIQGVNASERDAKKLAGLLRGMLCKVNLIPYNPIEEFPHAAPSYREVVLFQKILQGAGVQTTVRFSKGRDIQAACGQLRSAARHE